MEAKEKSFNEIKVGDSAFIERAIALEDILKFAQISGDYNPLHTEKDYAIKAGFRGQVVHGMFIASLVSDLVGMELPGKKALLLKESLEFKKPSYAGDALKVLGKVTFKSEATKIIELSIEIYNNKEIVVFGSVSVRVLK